MRKKALFLKAILVLLITTGLVSFKADLFGAGTIYCFSRSVNVNPMLSCNAVTQPASYRIDYVVSVNSTDPTINPCLSEDNPYDGSNPGSCIQEVVGVTHFRETSQ